MGQTANILGVGSLRRPQLPIPILPRVAPGTSASARLIPGMGNFFSAPVKKGFQSVMRDGTWASTSQVPPPMVEKTAAWLLPGFLKRFHPAKLGVATLHAAPISLACAL